MTSIVLKSPPLAGAYQYRVEGNALQKPETYQLNELNSELGSKINPKYETAEKWTPVQKKRIAAISAVALCAIAAVGVIVAACLTAGIGLIAFAALTTPFFIGGGITAGLYAYFKNEDLDSPKYRQNVMKEIAASSLETIANRYWTGEIVGYRLLDRMASTIVPEQRLTFYWRFTNLMEKLYALQEWKGQQESAVDAQYAEETKPIREWHDLQKQIYHQQQMILGLGQHTVAQEYRHQRSRGNRVGTAIMGGLLAGNTVASYYEGARAVRTLEGASAIYGEKVGPWKQWKRGEHASIDKAYDAALGVLEQQFIEIKSSNL
jgi:hypothetical protein